MSGIAIAFGINIAIDSAVFPYIIVIGIRLVDCTYITQVTATINVSMKSTTDDSDSGITFYSAGYCK